MLIYYDHFCMKSNSQETSLEDVAGVSVLDSDVSILTPSSAPGVLDEPVALIETEGSDGVVV
jgi:hypothetical protein